MNQEIFDNMLNASAKRGQAQLELRRVSVERYEAQERMYDHIMEDIANNGSYRLLVYEHAVGENFGMDVPMDDNYEQVRGYVKSYVAEVYCFPYIPNPEDVESLSLSADEVEWLKDEFIKIEDECDEGLRGVERFLIHPLARKVNKLG